MTRPFGVRRQAKRDAALESLRGSKIKEGTLSVQSLQTVAYVALGSNLGDARKNVLQAIERLQAFSERSLHKSSLWKTTPVDCPPDSADFVNAVVALVPRAEETPESLFKKLQALEEEFGRRPKKIMNEPRPLDLDLIAFGDEQRTTPELTLPHPRSHQRRFVLQPLAELAPHLVLPGQQKTIAQLLAELPPGYKIHKLSVPD